ncbi:hypothetical protein EXIGLDRAFT_776117 [Exidia glandulosa HHB12029]|uniref:Uncharacterized protein n=1 Tax=Exidia glandulosa HHB12029 TaxID=1314781 RepID=A0A165DLZ4_EXIGL|nr:hypothetical protein EXIGLDRAFT_776117 [Exidia glandulosa HHB12029]
MTTLATLPLDVLARILALAADYNTLHAAALSCKNIYGAYAAYPTGIPKSVAFNLIPGAALAPALRAIRVGNELESISLTSDKAEDIMDKHDEARVFDTPLTLAECAALQSRTLVASRIEALYSRRFKDRTSESSSRLLAGESEVFQKALHRIWLFTHVIRHCYVDYCDEVADFEWREDLFYANLSSQDLWEIETIRRWLYVECEDLEAVVEPDCVPIIVQVGPEGFIKIFNEEPYELDEAIGDVDQPIEFEWEEDILAVLEARKIDLPEDESAPKGLNPILQVVFGKDDMCASCSSKTGLALLNQTNWEYTRWLRSLYQFQYLPPNLVHNNHERRALETYFRYPLQDVSIPTPTANTGSPISTLRVLRELFDLPNVVTSPRLQAHMLADGFSSITPHDWLCPSCLIDFITRRLWIWWWNEKARGRVLGEPLREDCWYGYECRTQTHNSSHAQRLNHLCVNTNEERLAAKRARGAQGHGGGA